MANKNPMNLDIGVPKNYFSGTIACSLPVPQNILMFHTAERKKIKSGAQHHRFLLVLNIEGDGEAIVDGERFRLDAGHGLLIFPFQHHLFLNPSEQCISWLKISFELDSYEYYEILRNKIFEIKEEMFDFIHMMTNKYSQESVKDFYLSHRLIFSLAGLLVEILKSNKIIETTSNLSLIDKVNQYVYEHINKPLLIPAIAKTFHFSESHLRAKYKKEMGISLGNYILEMKMHKAQSYLGVGDFNIYEIAIRCGYLSQYSFSNAFKAYHKVSPSQYRKDLLSKPRASQ